MQETMRPIALLKIDKVGFLNVLLRSFGITASHLPSLMEEQSDLCSALLSTPKSLDMRQVIHSIAKIRKKNFLAFAAILQFEIVTKWPYFPSQNG